MRLLWSLRTGCFFAIVLTVASAAALPVTVGSAKFTAPHGSLLSEWESVFKQAITQLESGRTEAGREDLKRLLASNPNYIQAEMALGYSYLFEEPRQSLVHAWSVLGQTDRNLDALNLLSAAYARLRDLAQTTKEEATKRTHEVEAYRRILDRMPDWPEVIFRTASQRIAIERLAPERFDELDKAVAELKRLTSILQDDSQRQELATAHFQLGRAYKHQEDARPSRRIKSAALPERYRLAVQEFEVTLRMNAARVDALGEIVLVYLAVDDAATALATVQGHIPKLTGGVTLGKANEMLGGLFVKLGKREAAIAEFDRALQNNENLMASYLHLAALNLKKGDKERAIQVLKKSVGVQPDFLSGHLRLGSIYLADGRYPDAIGAFEQALQVPKSRAVVLGMIPSKHQYRNGLYYRAAASLAWLQLETGAPEQALETAKAAVQFGAADSHLLDTLGMIYEALGERGKAIETLNQAAKAPGLPSAHYHLAQIYVKQDDLELARRHLDKALSSGRKFYYRSAANALKRKIGGASVATPGR